MEPYLGECFGNPSSGHVYGRRVRSDCAFLIKHQHIPGRLLLITLQAPRRPDISYWSATQCFVLQH